MGTARLLSTALRAARFYPTGHDRVLSAFERLTTVCHERIATGGRFEIALEGGSIVRDDDGKHGPRLDALAAEMQRRSIRAIRIESVPSRVEIEKLVTLLGEPPLELTARGGVDAAAEDFESIVLVPYRYRVDAEGTAREVPGTEDSTWDLERIRAETTATGLLSVDDIGTIPGVVDEIRGLRSSLDPDIATEESEAVVSGILRVALSRLAGPEGAGSGALPPSPGRTGHEPQDAIGPLHAIADRIYAIALAHLTAGSRFDESEWTPSESVPGLHPVDPRRLLHTKSLLDTRLAIPSEEEGGGLRFDRPAEASEVALGLLTGDGDRAARDAYVTRIADSVATAEDPSEREEILGRLAGLLFRLELPPMSLVEVLGALRRMSSSAELARALIARMPSFVGSRVRGVAERVDVTTIEHVIEGYLRGGAGTRKVALAFLRAAAERVISTLVSGARHPDPKHRRLIVDLARELDGSGAPRLLDRLARDEDPHVSLAALQALARRSDEESLGRFERAVADSPPEIWRPLAQTATGPGELRVPRLLHAIVRGDRDRRRPLRERLEALRALDRVRGTAGRERVVRLSRFFSLHEPAASVMIRREARRLLRTSPSTGAPGSGA